MSVVELVCFCVTWGWALGTWWRKDGVWRTNRNNFKGLDTGTESYELPKSVWEAIGDTAAWSGDTIPLEFGARMPNIYMERSSMTAETWSIWIMYLGPILLQDRFLKPAYYEHFMKLLRLVHLCMSYEMRQSDIKLIQNGFIEWVREYKQYALSYSTVTCVLTNML